MTPEALEIRKARTPKQKATVVESCITEIRRIKLIKFKEINKGAEKKKKVSVKWFNGVIKNACIKHNISEKHIRLVLGI